MGFMKFVGKTIADQATQVVSGASEAVINTVGNVAKATTNKVLDVSSEVSKHKGQKELENIQNVQEKLTKLKSMLDAGILTQEEFDAKKTDILSKM